MGKAETEWSGLMLKRRQSLMEQANTTIEL
jgi:hypothetical protein